MPDGAPGQVQMGGIASVPERDAHLREKVPRKVDRRLLETLEIPSWAILLVAQLDAVRRLVVQGDAALHYV